MFTILILLNNYSTNIILFIVFGAQLWYTGAVAQKLTHGAHAIWLLLAHMRNEDGAAFGARARHFPIRGAPCT